MKSLLFLSALLLSSSVLQAQYSRADLLSNPQVIWVGEDEADFFFDELDPTDVFRVRKNELWEKWKQDAQTYYQSTPIYMNYLLANNERCRKRSLELEQRGVLPPYTVHPLKFQAKPKYHRFGSPDIFLLGDNVLDSVFWSKQPLFKDAEMRNRYTVAELSKRTKEESPLFDINPETSEMTQRTVIYRLYSENLDGYRVKRLFYYNQKTNQISVVIDALAPLVILRDDNGNRKGVEPLYWMRLKHQTTALDLTAAAIVWAKRTEWMVDLDRIHTIKGEHTPRTCLQMQIDYWEKNYEKVELYDYTVYGTPRSDADTVFISRRMSPEEVKDLNHYEGITFDPNTFVDVPTRMQRYKMEEIRFFQFHTDWYWDITQQQLVFHPVVFSPCTVFEDRLPSLFEDPLDN